MKSLFCLVIAGVLSATGVASAQSYDRPDGPALNAVWVGPVYRTVINQVWVPPEYGTTTYDVWHEPIVATRYVPVFVAGYYSPSGWVLAHTETHLQRVIVSAGYYERIARSVLVRAGFYTTENQTVLVSLGHWYVPVLVSYQ
jgi:hypothetical protein